MILNTLKKAVTGIFIACLSLSTMGQPVINQSLKKELDSILTEDQHLRELISSGLLQTRADSLAQAFNIEKDQLISYVIKQTQITDSLNIIRVEQIIKQYGYPGLNLVGPGTNEAAYFVIQHSAKIDTYLPMIKKAAENKQIKFALYAMMLDRSLMYKGKEQVYGTQGKGVRVFNKEKGVTEFKMVIWPIKDVAGVNKRRKKAGFTSTVEDYAKDNLGIDYKILSLADIKELEGK
jgi:hypothetical protein